MLCVCLTCVPTALEASLTPIRLNGSGYKTRPDGLHHDVPALLVPAWSPQMGQAPGRSLLSQFLHHNEIAVPKICGLCVSREPGPELWFWHSDISSCLPSKHKNFCSPVLSRTSWPYMLYIIPEGASKTLPLNVSFMIFLDALCISQYFCIPLDGVT